MEKLINFIKWKKKKSHLRHFPPVPGMTWNLMISFLICHGESCCMSPCVTSKMCLWSHWLETSNDTCAVPLEGGAPDLLTPLQYKPVWQKTLCAVTVEAAGALHTAALVVAEAAAAVTRVEDRVWSSPSPPGPRWSRLAAALDAHLSGRCASWKLAGLLHLLLLSQAIRVKASINQSQQSWNDYRDAVCRNSSVCPLCPCLSLFLYFFVLTSLYVFFQSFFLSTFLLSLLLTSTADQHVSSVSQKLQTVKTLLIQWQNEENAMRQQA